MAKSLILLSLALTSTAAVVPEQPQGFLSLPIIHEPRTKPISNVKRDADVTIYNISSVSYLVQLGIGSPAQNVKVVLDTGSSELWVDPNCNNAPTTLQMSECQSDGTYDPSKSSSAKSLGTKATLNYGIGSASIRYYTDTVALAGTSASLSNMQFGVASTSTDVSEGILGVSYGNASGTTAYPNFVDLLVSQKVTNSKAFSVALGSVDASNGGVAIFGGVDTQKFVGPLYASPILTSQQKRGIYRYWVQMSSVGMTSGGSSKTYTGGNVPVVLDTGSTISSLPQSVVTAMASDFNGQLQRDGTVLVDCKHASDSGTIDFTFGNLTIHAPIHQFIWNAGANTCFLGAQVGDSSRTTLLLGDTFLRSTYVVFDQDSNQIYMAPYQNCGTHEQSIPAGNGSVAQFVGECKATSAAQALSTPKFGAWTLVAVAVGIQAAMSLL